MSETVKLAFRALGTNAARREIAQVAQALRESGDDEVRALFNPPPAVMLVDPGSVPFDHAAMARVALVAESVGVGHGVALDLYTAVVNPGWAPFGQRVFVA
jgi:hypothetical protein